MSIKTTSPVFWLPIVSYWIFLFVLQSNHDTKTLEGLLPLIIYFVVSFLLTLQLQLVSISKKEGFIVKFGTANIIFCSLRL